MWGGQATSSRHSGVPSLIAGLELRVRALEFYGHLDDWASAKRRKWKISFTVVSPIFYHPLPFNASHRRLDRKGKMLYVPRGCRDVSVCLFIWARLEIDYQTQTSLSTSTIAANHSTWPSSLIYFSPVVLLFCCTFNRTVG